LGELALEEQEGGQERRDGKQRHVQDFSQLFKPYAD
jgi:hypothetical protein